MSHEMRARIAGTIGLTKAGCWLWAGRIDKDGYGRMGSLLAHRASYEAFVSEVPAGLELDHVCRVRHCVNPEHLEPVTHQENVRRAAKTHCKRGHEFTAENTYLHDSKRKCKECGRMRVRQYREQKRAAEVAA